MSPVPSEREEAMVRAAIRRFNDSQGRSGNGDGMTGHGHFVLGEITAVDGHVLAVGEWQRDRPGDRERSVPLVLSWAFTGDGDVTGIRTFATTEAAIAATKPDV